LFDYLFLKTFFHKYFELADGFNIENINEIEYSDKNIHPDVVIAFNISASLNKYIGISHLCCFACAVVIDSLGLDFRGINSKFEIRWKSPIETNHNFHYTHVFESIVAQFQKFELNLEEIEVNDNIYKYNWVFQSRKEDMCNHSSNIISDDICHIIHHFKKSNSTKLLFSFITMEQLIEIGNYLIKRCNFQK
jgi:hypothetical protein